VRAVAGGWGLHSVSVAMGASRVRAAQSPSEHTDLDRKENSCIFRFVD